MPKMMQDLIEQYVEEIKKIYGSYVRQIILYGSCARGDFRPDSDVDIMILADISDLEFFSIQISFQIFHADVPDHILDFSVSTETRACNVWSDKDVFHIPKR